MKLLTLKLHNFRQFYNTTPTIHFPADSGQAVTVFHGMNGSGKTALLNAFTWTLYNTYTRGFQDAQMIVNLKALREAAAGTSVHAWVELEFEHDGINYRVRRCASALRSEQPDDVRVHIEDATLQWCGADGEWASDERVRDVIARILPPELHSYFFFDGERIERIVEPSREEQKRLAYATKRFLGIELLDHAEKHIKGATKILESELRDFGDQELKTVGTELLQAGERLEDVEDKLKQAEDNVDGFESTRRRVDRRLSGVVGVSKLQEERQRLQRERETIVEAIREGSKQVANLLSTKAAYLSLTTPAVRFNQVIDGMRTRRELPAGIKDTFVKDLLTDERCICGRSLDVQTEARAAVESWLAKAGRTDVEEAALTAHGSLRAMWPRLREVWAEIEHAQVRERERRRRISAIDDRLQQLQKELQASPTEDARALESRRAELEEKIKYQNRTIGGLVKEKEKLEEISDRLKKMRDRYERAQGRAATAQRRVRAADDALARLRALRTRLEEQFRADLERQIEATWEDMTITNYRPVLDRRFHLRLVNDLGAGRSLPVAASQGENQSLSLAFISSIIEFTRKFDAKRSHLPSGGRSSYPLVMDSPFGSLDPHYRRTVGKKLPTAADQIVIMVTVTQWRDEVEEALHDHVGAHYGLVYHTPREPDDDHTLVLAGQSHELLCQTQDGSEYTEIVELWHA